MTARHNHSSSWPGLSRPSTFLDLRMVEQEVRMRRLGPRMTETEYADHCVVLWHLDPDVLRRPSATAFPCALWRSEGPRAPLGWADHRRRTASDCCQDGPAMGSGAERRIAG